MDQIVSDSDYENLPEDDELCFVAFESKIRANMTTMLNDDDNKSQDYFQSVKSQYMTAVYAVAVECSINSLPKPDVTSRSNFFEIYNIFELAVQGEVARIRIRGRRSIDATSVSLLENTKTKIIHHISQLRHVIADADLSSDKRQSLSKKLDDLEKELEARRLNLGKTMLMLTCVVSGLANVTTIASDGQAAILHIQNTVVAIMKEVGDDKVSEDKANQRLAPPPKALPAPSSPPKTVVAERMQSAWEPPGGGDLDDEIPF